MVEYAKKLNFLGYATSKPMMVECCMVEYPKKLNFVGDGRVSQKVKLFGILSHQTDDGRVSQKSESLTFWDTLPSNRCPAQGPRPGPQRG